MVAFTVANYGPDTTHLIALWVDNATLHQRYEMSIYVNSGDTVSFSRADLSLPNQSFTVKIVTERGNIAVFVPS